MLIPITQQTLSSMHSNSVNMNQQKTKEKIACFLI